MHVGLRHWFGIGRGRRRALDRHFHWSFVVRTLAEGKHAELTPLAEAMTPEPVTIDPDARAVDALRRMNDYGFRHLPVVQSGKILGILTRSSFKGMEIDQLDEEIHLWECIR